MKWGKKDYEVTIDGTTSPAALMQQVEQLTGVPVGNQKIMAKKGWKGVLSNDTKLKVKPGKTSLTLMGSTTDTISPVQAGPSMVTFVEDMSKTDALKHALKETTAATKKSTNVLDDTRVGNPFAAAFDTGKKTVEPIVKCTLSVEEHPFVHRSRIPFGSCQWNEFLDSLWKGEQMESSSGELKYRSGSDAVMKRLQATPYEAREEILTELSKHDPPRIDFSFLPHPCAMLSKTDLQRLFTKLKLPEDVVHQILEFEPALVGGKLCRALCSARLSLQVARRLTSPFSRRKGPSGSRFAAAQVEFLSVILRKACDFVKAATGGYDWWTQKEENHPVLWDPVTLRWRAKHRAKLPSVRVSATAESDRKQEQANQAMAAAIEDLLSKDESDAASADEMRTDAVDPGRTFELTWDGDFLPPESNDLYDYWANSGR